MQDGITKAINQKGDFDVVKNNPNSIEDAAKDNKGNFSFSFAVDLNSLPFSESYFKNENNYELSNNYEIGEIQKIKTNHKAFLPVLNNFHPSHIITLVCKTKSSHVGSINLQLRYVLPIWINKTLINEDVNSPLTFGFDKLTSGIANAYNVFNQNKNLAEFKFQVTR